MKKDSKLKTKQNKGKLVYKSKTPKKKKGFVIYILCDIGFIYFFFTQLSFLVTVLIYSEFPIVILFIISSILGMFLTGIVSSVFTFLIISKLLVYLFIYENGIEIRKILLFPLKFKRHYLSYEQITKVEVKKRLYVHQEDGDPIVLYHFEFDGDLKEAKDIILKYKKEAGFSNLK